MPKPFILRHLTALALVTAGIGAQAADFSFAGNLVFNTDVVQFSFSVAAPGDVRLWTDSWLAGLNIDPTLALFDSGLNHLLTGDDSPDPTALLPGQGGYDATLTLGALAPGVYRLALSASGQDALGPTLGNGFSLDGSTPIAIAQWNQPSYDLNTNDQKGSFWQLHIDGVDQASVVPEPAGWALMLGGLTGLVALARRRR